MGAFQAKMRGGTVAVALSLLLASSCAVPHARRQSEVTYHDYAKVDPDFQNADLPRVQRVTYEPTVTVDMLQLMESGPEVSATAPAAMASLSAPEAVDPKDPWAQYGGERSLFCRVQYYHD